MASSNYISKVAVVGANGNSGRLMTEALLKTGRHTVTALTRIDSQNQLPRGVIRKEVDYDKLDTLIEALRDQDALVITLSGRAPKETEMQLIEAAGEANVGWILPNEWGPDTANEAMVKDMFAFQPKVATRKAISDLGKSGYIAVSTGFWYEWCLAMPAGFGIDFANRAVTLFDEGDIKISTSTLPQVGRAVAALLSLPIKSESSTQHDCLESFKNQVVYISSFTVSQKDMFESALRVTKTEREDWTVTKEPVKDRFLAGMQEIKEGKHTGFQKMISRVFYPDGSGNMQQYRGTLNGLLNLPKEDIDEATIAAIERSKLSN